MTHSALRAFLTKGLASTLLLLAGCTEVTPSFVADARPQRLSEWNLFDLNTQRLQPLPIVEVVKPANPLFTDYAHKLRTLWMPEGTQATLVNDEIDYPVGTVLSKTFYYLVDDAGNVIRVADQGARVINLADSRLIETRVLVRQEAGWDALPYV